MWFLAAQDQRQTIPAAIAEGAVASVATRPSGQAPTMESVLADTDVVVTGTVGEPRSYLSEDQRDVYTDYPVADAVFRYQSKLSPVATPGIPPAVIVTQLGGTIMINGVSFTQKETALPPLQPGISALFLLRRNGGKHFIAGGYFGAFAIVDGRLRPLVSRSDFAPEYVNQPVSTALYRLATSLRTSG